MVLGTRTNTGLLTDFGHQTILCWQFWISDKT